MMPVLVHQHSASPSPTTSHFPPWQGAVHSRIQACGLSRLFWPRFDGVTCGPFGRLHSWTTKSEVVWILNETRPMHKYYMHVVILLPSAPRCLDFAMLINRSCAGNQRWWKGKVKETVSTKVKSTSKSHSNKTIDLDDSHQNHLDFGQSTHTHVTYVYKHICIHITYAYLYIETVYLHKIDPGLRPDNPPPTPPQCDHPIRHMWT